MRQEINTWTCGCGCEQQGVPVPGKVQVVAVRAERGPSEERTERLYDVLAEDVAAQDPERWDGLS